MADNKVYTYFINYFYCIEQLDLTLIYFLNRNLFIIYCSYAYAEIGRKRFQSESTIRCKQSD